MKHILNPPTAFGSAVVIPVVRILLLSTSPTSRLFLSDPSPPLIHHQDGHVEHRVAIRSFA
jgi:hypothetical protein